MPMLGVEMVQTDFETGNWFKSFDRRTVMRNAAWVLRSINHKKVQQS